MDVPFPHFTPRERDILDHLAAGLINAQIGQRLHLSGKPVANITTILAKRHLIQRSQAIIQARDAGLGGTADP
ncbi:response regulator transcription factor [Phytohabitans maris]|uniref:response regulator transcription factor n=1 Tax=Phytohabitans maris TaxID=3071409 RepID=UPI003D1746A0